jgi:hypothetical protein
MTAEQKVAAAERLEKAREARKEKNPDYGMSNVHESLRDLPKEHHLHPDKVKKWIKTQKDLLKSERAAKRQNVKGSIAQVAIHEGYIRSMQKYLRDGDWVDIFYGEHQEKKVSRRVRVPAYHWFGINKGKIKRDVGTFYDDIGSVWTEKMFAEESYVGHEPIEVKKKSRKRRAKKSK